MLRYEFSPGKLRSLNTNPGSTRRYTASEKKSCVRVGALVYVGSVSWFRAAVNQVSSKIETAAGMSFC